MSYQQPRRRWFGRKGRDSQPKSEPIEDPPRVFRIQNGGASFSSFFTSDKRPLFAASSLSVAQRSTHDDSEIASDQHPAVFELHKSRRRQTLYAGPEYRISTSSSNSLASSVHQPVSVENTKGALTTAGSQEAPNRTKGGLFSMIRRSPSERRRDHQAADIQRIGARIESQAWADDIPVAVSSFDLRALAAATGMEEETRKQFVLSSEEYSKMQKLEQKKRELERKRREEDEQMRERMEVTETFRLREDADGTLLHRIERFVPRSQGRIEEIEGHLTTLDPHAHLRMATNSLPGHKGPYDGYLNQYSCTQGFGVETGAARRQTFGGITSGSSILDRSRPVSVDPNVRFTSSPRHSHHRLDADGQTQAFARPESFPKKTHHTVSLSGIPHSRSSPVSASPSSQVPRSVNAANGCRNRQLSDKMSHFDRLDASDFMNSQPSDRSSIPSYQSSTQEDEEEACADRANKISSKRHDSPQHLKTFMDPSRHLQQ